MTKLGEENLTKYFVRFLEDCKKDMLRENEQPTGSIGRSVARIEATLKRIRENCLHTNKNNCLGVCVCLDCRSVLND